MTSWTYPVLAGEAVSGAITGRPTFPFRSWAANAHFKYLPQAEYFFASCGSAAEAYFIRPFTLRAGFAATDNTRASAGGVSVELQARCGQYYIDALISDPFLSLAVEIDGIGFHQRAKEQVARDYLRERRIVLRGYPVIRFTAQEAFAGPDECWRQIDAILDRRGLKS